MISHCCRVLLVLHEVVFMLVAPLPPLLLITVLVLALLLLLVLVVVLVLVLTLLLMLLLLRRGRLGAYRVAEGAEQ